MPLEQLEDQRRLDHLERMERMAYGAPEVSWSMESGAVEVASCGIA